ncbi:hypothetical protein GCM10023198_53700 [Promicromonospora umidemergens]|uniref:Uncharacterized protein n=1 Tax=Promicromonospora umidemergens TaxID=629679 RepID=A0ABP8Y8H1_9MICO
MRDVVGREQCEPLAGQRCPVPAHHEHPGAQLLEKVAHEARLGASMRGAVVSGTGEGEVENWHRTTVAAHHGTRILAGSTEHHLGDLEPCLARLVLQVLLRKVRFLS